MSVGSLALLALIGAAPDAAITARASIATAKYGPGDSVVLAVDVDIPTGWHLWAIKPGTGDGPGPQALQITLDNAPGALLAGEWRGTAPTVAFDRGFERELAHYPGGATAHFERVVTIDRAATPGARAGAQVSIRGQICTEETCLSQRITAPLAIIIADRGSGAAAAKPNGVALTGAGSEGFFAFIMVAFLAGLAALATPCVFPAIPLTVSFFSKYSEESFGRGARLAAFYAVSMVACFTFAGVVLSVILGATGVQQFASHPVFNLILAMVLVFFSLNLLGMFEIQAPAFLLAFTNRLEARWGPAAGGKVQHRAGLGDYVAVGIAAVTATTVFFTCTVAFVGVVVVAAADGEWFWPTIGMLAFSSAFVLPFFLLALFPQAARRLRGKNGNWLVVTRVTLGFVELAAAWKFFSNADLVWRTNLLSRDLVLALWVSLFGLCAMFLLGKLRLGDDHTEGEIRISVPRMLIASGAFAFTLFLALGLFTGRSLGWIDGWLPPATLPGETAVASSGVSSGSRSASAFNWIHDLDAGRAEAAKSSKLVFVNYTGYTCTNCRYMEGGVFPKPAIKSLLDTMVQVELYTDGQGPEYEKNGADQIKRFGTAALPFYVVERADGTVIATFPSSTNDPEEFRRFLADAIKAASVQPVPTSALTLATTRLDGGASEPAIVAGKWTLMNFWATWCGPCREELKSFLVDVGQKLEAKGGRFAAIALEEEESRVTAVEFMRSLNVPAASSLHLPPSSALDPSFGFEGDLPYTVLIAPDGRVAWRHNGKLERAQLEATLDQHMGLATLRQ